MLFHLCVLAIIQGMVLQRDDSLNGVFIWQLLYDCDAFSSGEQLACLYVQSVRMSNTMYGEAVHFTIIECVCTHVVHTGQFHEGDEVLEVNGISVSGMSAPQAMKILVS